MAEIRAPDKRVQVKKDLTGMKFGRWTVLEQADDTVLSSGKHIARWLCRCECGTEKVINGLTLKSGETSSCGCSRHHAQVEVKQDLTGKKFGRLTVVRRDEDGVKPDGTHVARWICQCDCGTIRSFRQSALVNQGTQSCGCKQREVTRARNETHGFSKTRLYTVWGGMINRCANKGDKNYKNYGAKGISVCDEWKHDFAAFREWAITNGYDENAPRGKCTIDRIDYTGNYSPENCRIVDMKEQARNTSRTQLFTWNGETKAVKDWAKTFGFNYTTLYNRIFRSGMSFEDAISAPLREWPSLSRKKEKNNGTSV